MGHKFVIAWVPLAAFLALIVGDCVAAPELAQRRGVRCRWRHQRSTLEGDGQRQCRGCAQAQSAASLGHRTIAQRTARAATSRKRERERRERKGRGVRWRSYWLYQIKHNINGRKHSSSSGGTCRIDGLLNTLYETCWHTCESYWEPFLAPTSSSIEKGKNNYGKCRTWQWEVE